MVRGGYPGAKVGFVALLSFFSIWGSVWAWVPDRLDDSTCHLRSQAAWISVDWTSSPVDEAAVAALAADADLFHLRYLYPYVSYLKADGTFSSSYAYAGDFVRYFRQHNQDSRLLAWIGIPIANGSPIGIQGWVDLSDEQIRQQIATFASQLIVEHQFDGIHLNVETVWDGDPAFLALLDDVRAAIGPDATLSIAGAHWTFPVLAWLPVIGDFRWRTDYYQEVAARVDQVATMTYDSLAPHPALYRLWMREQVKGLHRTLAPTGVELLIGISVSHEQTLTHQPFAENLQSGLAGLCAALDDLPEAPGLHGVAIYAAWEATDPDWQLWQSWLQHSP
jgi:hypothetical protein